MIIGKVGTVDVVVIVIYFVSIMVTGFVSMCRSNRNTIKGYFLAGQFMIWLPVGASLFASNIGSEHFIGLAGSGAAKGIGVAAFELNASILLQLLGWVFLPVFINSGAYTLPQYMKRRFGGNRIQCYLAVVSLMMYIFTKISVNLYSASLFIYEALHLNIWISVISLLILTGLITVTGGLAAVLYTDTLQCIIMIFGSVILSIVGFMRVGGMTGLIEKYGDAIARVNGTLLPQIQNSSSLHCYLPSKMAFKMLRPIDDPDMPWLGFLLGQTPASIWYWCADQMMVQRALASKNLSHAKGGTLFAGMLKLLPLFIMVMPGMISRILFADEIACATTEDCINACGQASGCSNLAYPKLVIGLLPDGLRGLMFSVMIAALVSDLTSIFNSSSTLFTVDIYRHIRPTAKSRELLITGRIFVLVMIGLSILWLPVIQNMQGGQLFIYIQAISGYLSPPIAAVYMVAIFWTRGNEKGAISGLIYGLLIGALRMILDFVWKEVPCEQEDLRPFFIQKFHYMYFAMFSFGSCILVMVLVSVMTDALPKKYSENTTYWSYMKVKIPDDYHDHKDISVFPLRDTENKAPNRDESEEKAIIDERGLTRKCLDRINYYWEVFVGLNDSNDQSILLEEVSEVEAQKSITKRLFQKRRDRILLNAIMVLLISFVTVLYIMFSVYFSEIEVGQILAFNQTK